VITTNLFVMLYSVHDILFQGYLVLENYAFIDGNNIYLGIKNLGWDLDYARFRIYLKEKHQVVKAFYFIGKIEKN
jgi:hypothetical protein